MVVSSVYQDLDAVPGKSTYARSPLAQLDYPFTLRCIQRANMETLTLYQ